MECFDVALPAIIALTIVRAAADKDAVSVVHSPRPEMDGRGLGKIYLAFVRLNRAPPPKTLATHQAKLPGMTTARRSPDARIEAELHEETGGQAA